MSGPVASPGLADAVAAAIVLSLNAYILMGGADYGGGLWDLLASGPRRAEQRALIASTIGPIWEANHVWLIIVVVATFTGFPTAFATIAIVLHVPIALMLIGIVLRGSAFVFRGYGQSDRAGVGWARVFAIASTVTPILLGVVVGALSTDAVGVAAAGAGHAASFSSVYVDPWLAPFPIAVGLLALSLFALVAAVYLTVEARDAAVREDFRRRALGAAMAVFVVAFGVLGLALHGAPRVANWMKTTPWAPALHVATAAAAVTVIWALWTRRYPTARIAVIVQVSLILWGWSCAQYPWLIPPTMSITSAAAPPVTLELLLIGLAGGAAILVPSLVYLFRTFSQARD